MQLVIDPVIQIPTIQQPAITKDDGTRPIAGYYIFSPPLSISSHGCTWGRPIAFEIFPNATAVGAFSFSVRFCRWKAEAGHKFFSHACASCSLQVFDLITARGARCSQLHYRDETRYSDLNVFTPSRSGRLFSCTRISILWKTSMSMNFACECTTQILASSSTFCRMYTILISVLVLSSILMRKNI